MNKLRVKNLQLVLDKPLVCVSRQEYCPPPGDRPNPGIKPVSPVTPARQADSLPLSHQGSSL